MSLCRNVIVPCRPLEVPRPCARRLAGRRKSSLLSLLATYNTCEGEWSVPCLPLRAPRLGAILLDAEQKSAPGERSVSIKSKPGP